jgi:phenylalanyl-tRNA synthetase alpha chain
MAEIPDVGSLLRTLDEQLERGTAALRAASTIDELEAAHVAALGRRSPLASVQRSLGGLSPEDRRSVGRTTNEVRTALAEALAIRRAELEAERERAMLELDRIDITLPGHRPRPGSVHPLTAIEDRVVDTFTRMGYRVVEGPEVETERYNFDALNIPPDHPARKVTDSVYLDVPGRTDLLLRTETSAMQIRTMEQQPPPVYVIAPGRVFRHDTSDATHTPVFHQVEGLAVDEGITFAHLKGTLLEFARAMFGPQQRVRLNPDFFPFVEPGAEVEVTCFVCGGAGAGCRTCKGTGWIELLGCGMVHPNVLDNVGYDPERYTGFAFGIGLERVALLAYGIPDIRMLYEGDVRFLEQFGTAS